MLKEFLVSLASTRLFYQARKNVFEFPSIFELSNVTQIMLGNIEDSISSPLSSPLHFGLLVKLNCTHIIDTRAPAANVAIQYWKRIRDRMIQPTSIKVKVLDGIDRASAYEQNGIRLTKGCPLSSVRATYPQMADRHLIRGCKGNRRKPWAFIPLT